MTTPHRTQEAPTLLFDGKLQSLAEGATHESVVDCASSHRISSTGKIVFTVLGAVAELERSLIAERVRAGLGFQLGYKMLWRLIP